MEDVLTSSLLPDILEIGKSIPAYWHMIVFVDHFHNSIHHRSLEHRSPACPHIFLEWWRSLSPTEELIA